LFTILQGGRVFSPSPLGVRDLVIAAGTITNIAEHVQPWPDYGDVEVVDVSGKYVVPGFIDQHVHLIGGGGEGGFATRTPEVALSHITRAGITTVVGCLGTDGTTRHVTSLLARARGLEEEGITAYIYTGAYEVPTCTIFGSVRQDIILIDKVIGCGEVAISDHRSAEPTREEIAKLAAQARVGGILSGKAGVLHLHVGDGKRRLSPLFDILSESDIPITQFTPTHLNRNRVLLEDAVRFARRGGMIDFTAGEAEGSETRPSLKPSEAVGICLAEGVDIGRMTMSSDGNGSMPSFDNHGRFCGLRMAEMSALPDALRDIVAAGVNLSDALRLVTVNPARSLRLYPRKGVLASGSDADVCVLDGDLSIVHVLAKGRFMVRDGYPVIKGSFEHREPKAKA